MRFRPTNTGASLHLEGAPQQGTHPINPASPFHPSMVSRFLPGLGSKGGHLAKHYLINAGPISLTPMLEGHSQVWQEPDYLAKAEQQRLHSAPKVIHVLLELIGTVLEARGKDSTQYLLPLVPSCLTGMVGALGPGLTNMQAVLHCDRMETGHQLSLRLTGPPHHPWSHPFWEKDIGQAIPAGAHSPQHWGAQLQDSLSVPGPRFGPRSPEASGQLSPGQWLHCPV